jgi:hypothetical protein
MKKLIALTAVLPTLTFAHESHTMSSMMHAVEHNLQNPLFAVAMLAVVVVGLAVLTQIVVKTVKK